MFNIPDLSRVSDLRQKRNCLVYSVLNSLDNLLLTWKDKVDRLERERSCAKESEAFFQQGDPKDPAEFLTIKTRYHCLRNRLKRHFYDKINEYMEIIEDYSDFKVSLNSHLQQGLEVFHWDDWQKNKVRPLSALVDKQLLGQKKVEWNSHLEQQYRQKRDNSRLQVSHFSRLNSYDALAIMPLINQLNKHEVY